MIRFLILLYVVAAQVYKFEHQDVPQNKSLHLIYTFYVYSKPDSPEQGESPFIRFHDLKVNVPDYNGIQLSVLKHSEFFNTISPNKFCCAQQDVFAGKCKVVDSLMPTNGTIPITTILGTKPSNQKFEVDKTGVYVLVYSNCGTKNEGEVFVDGSVIVRNPYGYLPAIEYHKMPFYGWLAIAYFGLVLVWGLLAMRWRKQLFKVQACIGIVICLSFLESLLWWFYFNDWNKDGVRPSALFVIAILVTVVKNISSYMLVLVASLGWGVTRPHLDDDVIRKIQFTFVLYIIVDVVRDVVLSFQHSHFISTNMILLCLLPVSVVNSVVFYWVFSALTSLMANLKEHQQTHKLNLFKKLWYVLVFVLVIVTVCLLYQVFAISIKPESTWMSQWFFSDGLSHIAFFVVTVAMLYLWAPNSQSHLYSYSYQLNADGVGAEETNPEAWATEGDDIVESPRDNCALDEETGALPHEDGEEAPVIQSN